MQINIFNRIIYFMAKIIKNFNSWNKINEGSSFGDWISSLAKDAAELFTGGSGEVEPSAAVGKNVTATGSGGATAVTGTGATVVAGSMPGTSTTPGEKAETLKPVYKKDSIFEILDLTTDIGFDTYSQRCQQVIDQRKPYFNTLEYHNTEMLDPDDKNAFPILTSDYLTGNAFAQAAKECLINSGNKIYLPWELAMAQCALEGGLSDEPTYKKGHACEGKIKIPIITKNPFNVGNTDTGGCSKYDVKATPRAQTEAGERRPTGRRYLANLSDGIRLYYTKMATSYLADKTADALLVNFVNVNGNRYATGQEYEEKLIKIIDGFKSNIS